jgi:hypothetical protein
MHADEMNNHCLICGRGNEGISGDNDVPFQFHLRVYVEEFFFQPINATRYLVFGRAELNEYA